MTIRSSSSVVSSPALKTTPQVSTQSEINSRLEWRGGLDNERGYRYRLLRSTSAFLMTTFEYLRPTPLIFVRANMTLSLPSTFVLRRRRMCWNAFLSGTTRAMLSVDGEALAGDLRVERESSHGRRGIGYAVSQTLEIHSSKPPPPPCPRSFVAANERRPTSSDLFPSLFQSEPSLSRPSNNWSARAYP